MNEIVTRINAPDEATLTLDAQKALDLARSMVIDSPPMMDIAASELRQIKAKYKSLEEQRVSLTKPLDQTKRGIMDLFRAPLEYLDQAEKAIKTAMVTYNRKIEQERAAEAARQAELARKEAEKLAAQAAKAEAAGKVEKAAELQARAEAATMVAPIVQEVHKAAGISTRKVYHAEVTDKMALLQFIVQAPMFANLVAEDAAALNALARAQKESFQIPGCRLVVEEVIASRAA